MEFWEKIQYKKIGCSLNGAPGCKFYKPLTSLYVVVGRECTTACKFCTFRGKSYDFDYDLFEKAIKGIVCGGELGKVQFTGGEPGMYLDIVSRCSSIIKRYSNESFISVNTNGTNLKELVTIPLIDNIALSRHAVTEAANAELMGVPVSSLITDDEIRTIAKKYPNLIHLSCNLVKGYVCDKDSIQGYLEYAADKCIYDVGFVSLMPVNEFCKEHFVDFKDIDIEGIPNLINNAEWSLKQKNVEVCRCRNYLYFSTKQQIVAAYSRFACKHKSIDAYVVYENNHLCQGFNGTVIL